MSKRFTGLKTDSLNDKGQNHCHDQTSQYLNPDILNESGENLGHEQIICFPLSLRQILTCEMRKKENHSHEQRIHWLEHWPNKWERQDLMTKTSQSPETLHIKRGERILVMNKRFTDLHFHLLSKRDENYAYEQKIHWLKSDMLYYGGGHGHDLNTDPVNKKGENLGHGQTNPLKHWHFI